MPKLFFRFTALLLIPCFITDPVTAASLQPFSMTMKDSLGYPELRLEEEALSSISTFVRGHMPFTKNAKSIRHEASRTTRSNRYRNKHRRAWVLIGGTVGLVLFLAASPHYKDSVTRWADGSERLTFLSLEPISWGYALFVSILSQAYLANESLKDFRLDWKMVVRAIGLAALFSTPFEGGYYEKWLPSLIPGDGWFIAWIRTLFDQIFSILFLDSINQYVQAWIVEGESRDVAMHDIHLYSLRFFCRSAPLWFLTVFLANMFSRPIINFSIINIGMIIWEFQLIISIHDTIPNAEGIKPRSRWRAWPRFIRFYDRWANNRLEHWPFTDIKALHRKKWYEKTMWGIAIAGTFYQLGWLTYPIWSYLVPIVAALAVMSAPLLRRKLFHRVGVLGTIVLAGMLTLLPMGRLKAQDLPGSAPTQTSAAETTEIGHVSFDSFNYGLRNPGYGEFASINTVEGERAVGHGKLNANIELISGVAKVAGLEAESIFIPRVNLQWWVDSHWGLGAAKAVAGPGRPGGVELLNTFKIGKAQIESQLSWFHSTELDGDHVLSHNVGLLVSDIKIGYFTIEPAILVGLGSNIKLRFDGPLSLNNRFFIEHSFNARRPMEQLTPVVDPELGTWSAGFGRSFGRHEHEGRESEWLAGAFVYSANPQTWHWALRRDTGIGGFIEWTGKRTWRKPGKISKSDKRSA